MLHTLHTTVGRLTAHFWRRTRQNTQVFEFLSGLIMCPRAWGIAREYCEYSKFWTETNIGQKIEICSVAKIIFKKYLEDFSNNFSVFIGLYWTWIRVITNKCILSYLINIIKRNDLIVGTYWIDFKTTRSIWNYNIGYIIFSKKIRDPY